MVWAIMQVLEEHFYKIIVGVVILLVGFVIGTLVKRLLLRSLKEIGLNKMTNKIGLTRNFEKMISHSAAYLIYLFTIISFLENLGLKSVVLYLLAGGILALLILTVLVGLKDIIPNFVGWFYLKRGNAVREGWKINIREIEGVVEHMGYLETEIQTEMIVKR